MGNSMPRNVVATRILQVHIGILFIVVLSVQTSLVLNSGYEYTNHNNNNDGPSQTMMRTDLISSSTNLLENTAPSQPQHLFEWVPLEDFECQNDIISLPPTVQVVFPISFITPQQNATHKKQHEKNGHEAQEFQKQEHQLPHWIRNYICWHNTMRRRFPGSTLFTLDAKVLVRTCRKVCGGLHDRLGQLPLDLYLANQTGRILLIHWTMGNPFHLENFVLPHLIDWSVPYRVSQSIFDSRQDLFKTGIFPSLIPDDRAWTVQSLSEAIEKFKDDYHNRIKQNMNNNNTSPRIVLENIFGHYHEDRIEELMKLAGAPPRKTTANTTSFIPPLGPVWHALFRPSILLQQVLIAIFERHGLRPHAYSVVHCRVRHPRNFGGNLIIKGKHGHRSPDYSGLPFHGVLQKQAVAAANHAIDCARNISVRHGLTRGEPFYFISDSSDLVNYLVSNQQSNDNKTKAANHCGAGPLVSHFIRGETVHMDRQQTFSMQEYMMIFVDLYIGMFAKCVAFGLGNFGYFATKLSGTICRTKHTMEKWGGPTNHYVGETCQ